MLIQALSKRGAFGSVKREFCPIGLSRASSGLEWYRALIWHICRVMWGPLNELSNASVCLSICL